jgi:drug/metabolite transporter (DMT)-like permease
MTSRELLGLFWGLIGVISFSLTLPATRIAVPHLGIGFMSVGRTVGAAVLAIAILLLTRQPWPRRDDIGGLALTALGVVIGFPFLTTLAMTEVPASHGGIVIALLPLSTAVASVILTGERPSLGFWLVSLAGTAILVAFILQISGGKFGLAHLALLGAVVSAATGYAKGGQLAARLGGWQVICWALAVALPFILVALPFLPATFQVAKPSANVPWVAWIGFAYVLVISQLAGFFAWYYGLATGGIARVSQVQMLQVFMTLAASGLLLGEAIDRSMLVYAAAVVATVVIGTRLRVASAKHAPAAAKS